MEDNEFEIPEISDKELFDIDVDQEWEKCAAEVGIDTKKVKVFKFGTLLKIAAAFVVMVSAAWFVAYSNSDSEQTFAALEQPIDAVVETNTQISINKNSKIICSGKKGEFNVNLQGEAYFDVEKNPNRTFKVIAGGATVIVHGTSFNVCQVEGRTIVSVSSGVVEVVNNKTGKKGVITKGQQITCTENSLEQTENYANCMAWKSKSFEFENSSLSQVMTDLSKVYDFKYAFADNKIKDYKLSSSFENQELNAIFHILMETLDIEIIEQGNKSYLIK